MSVSGEYLRPDPDPVTVDGRRRDPDGYVTCGEAHAPDDRPHEHRAPVSAPSGGAVYGTFTCRGGLRMPVAVIDPEVVRDRAAEEEAAKLEVLTKDANRTPLPGYLRTVPVILLPPEVARTLWLRAERARNDEAYGTRGPDRGASTSPERMAELAERADPLGLMRDTAELIRDLRAAVVETDKALPNGVVVTDFADGNVGDALAALLDAARALLERLPK